MTKYEYIRVVQGNYGKGWEDVTAEASPKQALVQLRTYRENEPQYSHRMISRRVLRTDQGG